MVWWLIKCREKFTFTFKNVNISQNRNGRCREDKTLSPLPGIEPWPSNPEPVAILSIQVCLKIRINVTSMAIVNVHIATKSMQEQSKQDCVRVAMVAYWFLMAVSPDVSRRRIKREWGRRMAARESMKNAIMEKFLLIPKTKNIYTQLPINTAKQLIQCSEGSYCV
jgi:hypothetical protein